MPKNLFKKISDYYLYILDYSDFDIKGDPDYSGNYYISGMSRILNNYHYDFENSSFEKLNSVTFHSDKVMSYRTIFDIENLNSAETRPARITPAFLFTTLKPDELNKTDFDKILNEEFIFIKVKPKDRNANNIPQLANEILSDTGIAVSRCTRSIVASKYDNVHIFDYSSSNSNNENLLESIKKDTTRILEKQETLENAIIALTNEQTTKVVNEIMNWTSTVAVELNNELSEKLEEIKKTENIQMKLKLSIPFIKLLGVDFETEFDLKGWTIRMYEKYEYQIFKLIGGL